MTEGQKLLCWVWYEMAHRYEDRPGRHSGGHPMFVRLETYLRANNFLTTNGEVVEGVTWGGEE